MGCTLNKIFLTDDCSCGRCSLGMDLLDVLESSGYVYSLEIDVNKILVIPRTIQRFGVKYFCRGDHLSEVNIS